MFEYSGTELTTIDTQLDTVLMQADQKPHEIEQIALDVTRLLSCTSDRLESYADQGFMKRCWGTLCGKKGQMMRANQTDLIEMQKYGWRYLELLNERDVLLSYSIITIKNNLNTLAVANMELYEKVDGKVEHLAAEITRMANRLVQRFEKLELRVSELEAATQIHTWLLGIDTYDYDENYPPCLRLLKVVHDFTRLKTGDTWYMGEIKLLQTAVKKVGLPWKDTISIAGFIEDLIEEIEQHSFAAYQKLVSVEDDRWGLVPEAFILDHVSAPLFASLYEINKSYTRNRNVIDVLIDQLSISRTDAIKKVLINFIQKQGINTDVELPIRDIAVEIFSCLRLAKKLYEASRSSDSDENPNARETNTNIPDEPVQSPEPTGELGQAPPPCPERIKNDLDMTFVYIPPGKFWMGSPDDEPKRGDNETMHEVILTQGFYMQTTPVTQLQWEKVMGSNPSNFKGDPRRPVENVSWNDVKAYIDKLHRCNGGHRYRLPTEAEWEYACRAGTTTPFAFGDNITPDQVNYDGNYPYKGPKGQYRKKITPVEIFEPNAWGLYDMHGNVWEWCQDCYGDYPSGSVEDPTGAESGVYRVLRGGSWNGYAWYCRSPLAATGTRPTTGTTSSVSCAAAPGSTSPGTAAPLAATGTRPTTGTTSSVSGGGE